MQKIFKATWQGALYLLAGLVLAEILLRLLGIAPVHYPAPKMLENADKSFGVECYPTNPQGSFPLHLQDQATLEQVAAEGGFSLQTVRSLAETLPFCVPYKYNRQTHRERPIEAATVDQGQKPYKILIVGDSFTEGSGVVNEHVFARRLETMLKETKGGRPVLVYNAGRRGMNLSEIKKVVEQMTPSLKPDLVLYAFVLNDFEQAPSYQAQQAFLNDMILDRQHMGEPTWKLPALLQHSRLVTTIAEKLRSKNVAAQTVSWYLGMTGTDNQEGWRRTQDDLGQMDALVRQHQGHFVVAILPLLIGLEGDGRRYPFSQLHQDLLKACQEMKVDCLDLLPFFFGQKSPDLWVHPVDMHPNAKGHQIIAQALFGQVRKLLNTSPAGRLDEMAP